MDIIIKSDSFLSKNSRDKKQMRILRKISIVVLVVVSLNLIACQSKEDHQSTISFSDYIKDGEYNVYDVNDDGFADFVTYYHQYAYIHFFIPLRNSFKESEFIMPAEGSTIDKKKHIYCGFHETMYGDKYSYSILFKYKGTIPIFYYKLVFITTKEGYEQMDKVKQIKLYKFQDNDYTKPVFVENLKTNKLRNFDYESYWKAHLNTFIGSR